MCVERGIRSGRHRSGPRSERNPTVLDDDNRGKRVRYQVPNSVGSLRPLPLLITCYGCLGVSYPPTLAP